MGNRRENLGELYELCDNSSYNCSSYAEFTVFIDDIQSSRVITYTQVCGKKYVVTIVRCIQTVNFLLREIGSWEKVRYNSGYVVNGVRCNASPL